MRKPRGDNQAKILAYIKQEIQDKGYPPSVREICDAVGLKSTSTVHGHLTRLEKKGLLHRDTMKPRAIEVLGDPAFNRHAAVPVPLVGRVAAGEPITALEHITDRIMLPTDIIGEGEHFILTIQGSSMIDAGIHDGDYVVVRSQPTAINGEIVVAMIDDEATVKRFYHQDDGLYRLQPENDAYSPIIVDDLVILGKIVAMFRRY
ncbi:transcriptional repressor LexA [Eubacteriales bacterium OttesenSCG-928-A19]|nr:transcriptional repressor LexA [Eubacteriales bacterium OttesenSCG-928-A19]